ncbi:UPF0496 protein At3g19330 [Euphorbia lathyris]|uniref:UPF0496 protein At3g19330 n=1 Tax=Euphorbia lathyris TaxID=212925 RepID=UPI003313A736
MLQCLSLNSPSPPSTIDLNHPPPSQAGTSTDGTPVLSPANLRREYTFYVQSNSYNEMYSRYHQDTGELIEFHFDIDDEDSRRLRLNQVLHPNRECVEEALRHARRNNLTDIVSNYFNHSENTTHHCLLLHQYVLHARALYDPLHKLLDILPLNLDSLTQSQCDSSYEIFLHFDRFDNPFPSPDSHSVQDLRRSFSELRQQLDHKLKKSRSRVSLVRRVTVASTLCIIGSAVAVTITAAAIATHALVAIVFCPFCTVANLPGKLTKKELAHLKQLDAAARGTYVLNNDLDTIDRLVARLHGSVEDDKNLIQFALATGSDKHPVSVVLKHLRKNYLNFIDLLNDLEERIYLYFNAVNRARNLLLQEIHLYQTSNS